MYMCRVLVPTYRYSSSKNTIFFVADSKQSKSDMLPEIDEEKELQQHTGNSSSSTETLPLNKDEGKTGAKEMTDISSVVVIIKLIIITVLCMQKCSAQCIL